MGDAVGASFSNIRLNWFWVFVDFLNIGFVPRMPDEVRHKNDMPVSRYPVLYCPLAFALAHNPESLGWHRLASSGFLPLQNFGVAKTRTMPDGANPDFLGYEPMRKPVDNIRLDT